MIVPSSDNYLGNEGAYFLENTFDSQIDLPVGSRDQSLVQTQKFIGTFSTSSYLLQTPRKMEKCAFNTQAFYFKEHTCCSMLMVCSCVSGYWHTIAATHLVR